MSQLCVSLSEGLVQLSTFNSCVNLANVNNVLLTFVDDLVEALNLALCVENSLGISDTLILGNFNAMCLTPLMRMESTLSLLDLEAAFVLSVLTSNFVDLNSNLGAVSVSIILALNSGSNFASILAFVDNLVGASNS
jgi:hypothetical protein